MSISKCVIYSKSKYGSVPGSILGKLDKFVLKDVFWEKCEKSSENLRKNVIFAYKNAEKM